MIVLVLYFRPLAVDSLCIWYMYIVQRCVEGQKLVMRVISFLNVSVSCQFLVCKNSVEFT